MKTKISKELADILDTLKAQLETDYKTDFAFNIMGNGHKVFASNMKDGSFKADVKDMEVSINGDQSLFVIPCADGFSCLGFDVLETRATRLGTELVSKFGYHISQPEPRGTLARYNQYMEYVAFAKRQNEISGWRSASELCPQLVGLEGKRVEVETTGGEIRRFKVGKSTGFIPCHLEIEAGQDGGGAICETFKSVKAL